MAFECCEAAGVQVVSLGLASMAGVCEDVGCLCLCRFWEVDARRQLSEGKPPPAAPHLASRGYPQKIHHTLAQAGLALAPNIHRKWEGAAWRPSHTRLAPVAKCTYPTHGPPRMPAPFPHSPMRPRPQTHQLHPHTPPFPAEKVPTPPRSNREKKTGAAHSLGLISVLFREEKRYFSRPSALQSAGGLHPRATPPSRHGSGMCLMGEGQSQYCGPPLSPP